MPKKNTKRQARCPVCNEKMKLVETKQVSAKYECPKHGQFIVAFLEKSMTNIFRQAKGLLDKKDAGGELTKEELQLINTAIIPLMVKTDGLFPEDITIGKGLEELAKILGEVTE